MVYGFVSLSVFASVFFTSLNSYSQQTLEKKLPTNYKAATAHLTTTCQVGKAVFTLNIGDDNTTPDSERQEFGFPYFWIVTARGRSRSALPPKEYNQLLFITPKGASVCKDTEAFVRPDGGVAIFVKQNNRPSADKLGVVFYNPKKGQVVAYSRNIGFSDRIESVGKELFFPVKDSPSDLASFNVTVGGKKSETIEEVFEYWNKVSRRNSQVIVSVNPELTYKRSAYKSYFKNQTAFDKAFAYSPEDKKYGYRWVYRVTTPDCIRISPTRFADGKNWICK